MDNWNNGTKGGAFCVSKAGMGIGDGAKTGVAFASTVGAGTDYCIDCYAYNKPDALTNQPFTAATIQPVLTKCLYLVCVDAAGVISSVKGDNVLTSDLVAGTRVLKFPELPANRAPLGAVKITLTGAATFTPGTTALDAAGVTATYYDLIGGIPSAPLLS